MLANSARWVKTFRDPGFDCHIQSSVGTAENVFATAFYRCFQ